MERARELAAGPAPRLPRVRAEGRAAVLWSLRITVAAVASYVVATLFFPGTQPLLAPLTAMLVVQVTPVSLLASGLDRVLAVVAGVLLAVGFAAVVPLDWWSLGLLILAAITVGQVLRLRANLIEVAISAMLVLGVGALGAASAAWQRIAETLVGAAVGIAANLLFPPKVASADAGTASTGSPTRSATCCAAPPTSWLSGPGRRRRRPAARGWLGEARRITHDIPRVGGRRGARRAGPSAQRPRRGHAGRRAGAAAGARVARAHGRGGPRDVARGRSTPPTTRPGSR